MNANTQGRKRKAGLAKAARAALAALAGTAARTVSPNGASGPPPVDPGLAARGRVFAEARLQTRPLAAPGTEAAARAADAIREGTARPAGLRPGTAARLATEGKSLDGLLSGANPKGKAAEIVAASDLRAMHRGRGAGMVNPPKRIAGNFDDIRVSPDMAARRDLILQARAPDGRLLSVPTGQIKTGTAKYICKDLVQMAETPGHGRVGYVDSRFANADGSPRAAADAFTRKQAARLRKAGVELRGVHDLDKRAGRLVDDIRLHGADGLDPAARGRLLSLRDGIARAYRPRGVAARAAGAAASSAAAAAVLSLVVQAASDGEIDLAAVGDAAAAAALFGAGAAGADAAIYHAATHFGAAPEAARALAANGVTAGLCLFAAGADILAEAEAAGAGEITAAGAVAGSAAKAALDILPLALAPLGLAGVPIFVCAQIAGRQALQRVRERDRRLKLAIAGDMARVDALHARLDRMAADNLKMRLAADECDRLVESALGKPVR